MQPIIRRILFGPLFLLLVNAECFGQTAALSSPERSGDQFQFNLEGDPYRRYVIQGSSNLHDWVLLTISVSTGPIHPLTFAASNDFSFFRSTLYSRTNSLSKAIQLTGSLNLKGNNFYIDSFDSQDPAWSTLGQYDPAKRRDAAEVSLDQGMTNSLGVGEALVCGSIAIGPNAPLVIGPNGSVGDLTWHNAAQKGVQPGKLSTDLNPYFLEIGDPFITNIVMAPDRNIWVTNIIVTGNVTNYVVEFYDYVFDNGNYRTGELDGKVLIRGNARVLVTANLDLTGNTENLIVLTNASLQLYVSAPDAAIKGMGEINPWGVATNFAYYGLSGNTNLLLSGNDDFTGIIYAPQAHVSLGGGGNDTLDFVGAIVAKSLQLNGHYNFHYDEALRELPFP